MDHANQRTRSKGSQTARVIMLIQIVFEQLRLKNKKILNNFKFITRAFDSENDSFITNNVVLIFAIKLLFSKSKARVINSKLSKIFLFFSAVAQKLR